MKRYFVLSIALMMVIGFGSLQTAGAADSGWIAATDQNVEEMQQDEEIVIEDEETYVEETDEVVIEEYEEGEEMMEEEDLEPAEDTNNQG